ncbi:hypothetical protein F5Y12DRAFT_690349 [Xylaria sp. FL1777]|nr:hypothetical protein F5Y12DRAFT_690349 [Xylaria sp. FL1777]
MMFSRHRSDTPSHHHRHRHRHHHHHHHRRSSSPQERHDPPEERPRHDLLLEGRIQIDLLDIDAPVTGRPPRIKIGARKTSNLENVASFLKARFDEGAERILPDDRIEFFHEQEQLHGDEIPKGIPALWYRALNPKDDGSFKLEWKDSYHSVRLGQPQLDEVLREIKSGATIGQLRRKVASYLLDKRGRSMVEPDQVVIEALGGYRPGPIQGDNWECRNIDAWLCRHLTIGLVRSGDFFVFYGHNERYILHRPSLNYDGTATGYCIKILLKLRVLTTICRTAGHLDVIRTEDISLYHRRGLVKDGTRFRAGTAFGFELSRDVGNDFIRLEAWLLPLTETCTICADEKRVSEMPTRGRITEDCEHRATACKDCISQWITSSMESVAWDRLKCPECPELLAFKDVETFATRDVFNRYDRLATKAVLEGIRGFRWCLNPACDAGQIFPLECEKAKCHTCKRSSCVRHDIPWHSGETCDEYDRRTRKQRKSYKLSEKHVKETTKPCPGCKKNVNKYSGCDHITCVCGHEWCWLCFATYTKDNESFLQCKHARECRYYTAPPFWEGRRALFPFAGPEGRQPPGARQIPIPLRRPQDFPLAMAEAGADRPRQNRPESPEPQPPDFPAELLGFFFDREPFAEGPRPRRHGMPFINEALLFDLAQLMERAR